MRLPTTALMTLWRIMPTRPRLILISASRLLRRAFTTRRVPAAAGCSAASMCSVLTSPSTTNRAEWWSIHRIISSSTTSWRRLTSCCRASSTWARRASKTLRCSSSSRTLSTMVVPSAVLPTWQASMVSYQWAPSQRLSQATILPRWAASSAASCVNMDWNFARWWLRVRSRQLSRLARTRCSVRFITCWVLLSANR